MDLEFQCWVFHYTGYGKVCHLFTDVFPPIPGAQLDNIPQAPRPLGVVIHLASNPQNLRGDDAFATTRPFLSKPCFSEFLPFLCWKRE